MFSWAPYRPLFAASRVALLAVAIAAVATSCGNAGAWQYSLGEVALSHLSPFEQRVLAKRYVTYADLQEAGQVVAECLISSGFTIQHRNLDTPGPSGIMAGFTMPKDTPSKIVNARTDVELQCYADGNAIEEVWDLEHQPSAAEVHAAEMAFVACGRQAGVPLEPQADYQDAASAANDAQRNSTPATEQAALVTCEESFTAKTPQALPGLQQALDHLKIPGSGS